MREDKRLKREDEGITVERAAEEEERRGEETGGKRRHQQPLVLLVNEVDFVSKSPRAEIVNSLSRVPPHEDILVSFPHPHY